MTASERFRRQQGLQVTHDWSPLPRSGTANYYEQRRRSWQCRTCCSTCTETYISHAQGWQKPMGWFARCQPTNPVATWYGSVQAAAIAQRQEAGRRQAEAMTLELRQPLVNEFRRKRPKGWTDAPLFGKDQEELFT